MKRISTLIFLLMLIMHGASAKDVRLVIITTDGLRWQEVFCGADSFLVGNKLYVKDTEALTKAYWRPTVEERRKALMPFTWDYVVKNGYLVGNRNKGSQMQVANTWRFSYPGYSENFVGYADDERVNENRTAPNPNTSVLEVANRDSRYHNNIMVYCTWNAIRYAVNNERGGFKGSGGFEFNLSDNPSTEQQALDRLLKGLATGRYRGRNDDFTLAYALASLRNDHPKVMYVAFGATDHDAHMGNYDKYIEDAHQFDDAIRLIVETCEADKFYRGKTVYLVTCDHGRGIRHNFKGHGVGIVGSEQTWLMAFGKGIEKLGETANNGPFYNQQFAATIADVLGISFTPDNGVRQLPITPHYHGTPLIDEDPHQVFGHFPALKDVKPVGQGASYSYYEGEFTKVEEVEKSPKLASGVLPTFDIKGAKKEDHFGYVFDAVMQVPRDGEYTLSCISDDGSCVWLDGQLIIDNDGSHSSNYKDAIVSLEAGYHRLKVKYLEDCEGQELQLGIEGSGFEFGEIPASMLFHE